MRDMWKVVQQNEHKRRADGRARMLRVVDGVDCPEPAVGFILATRRPIGGQYPRDTRIGIAPSTTMRESPKVLRARSQRMTHEIENKSFALPHMRWTSERQTNYSLASVVIICHEASARSTTTAAGIYLDEARMNRTQIPR